MLKEWFKGVIKLFAFFFLLLALWLVYQEIEKIGMTQIWASMRSTPFWVLGVAFTFVLLDYAAYSGYDLLALRYIGKKVPLPAVIETAMVSFSITNTTGHAYIAGGSIRYLLYAKHGLNEIDVLKMIAFESLTFLLGMACIFDLSLILTSVFHLTRLPSEAYLFDIGAVVVSVLFILYWFFVVKPNRRLTFNNTIISAPTTRMTLRQILIGSMDMIATSLVFYTLLRYHLDVHFFHVVSIFLLAQLIGISTQVPGGLGVFEGMFLYLFVHTPPEKAPILAALITFRIMYYFIPLGLGGIFFLTTAVWNKLKR